MTRNRRTAFTLVEVLTGIVVLGVISTCSWFAVSTLFRGEQLTRNRTIAINLLQKSQEEIRNASLTFYNTLESCQFPGPFFNVGTNNTCGLRSLNANFNGYTRSVSITPQNDSTEIKQAIITVNWTDQGNTVSMNSAVLLARPPDPLPGNIYGTVRSSDQGNALVQGATIRATLIGGGTTSDANSQSTLGAKNENYDFNTDTGAFVLPVGTWQLTATAPNYFDYPRQGTPAENILVTSNSETPFHFTMDPRPGDATIRIRLMDQTTSTQLTNFFSGEYYILDDFAQRNRIIHSAGSSTGGSYTIPFTDMNPKSFTINTSWAYRAGYAGKPNCSNYPYNVDGWSSAVVDETNTILSCGNPYNGSQSSDRITVNPNDNILVDVKLYPVPLATVKGKVIDKVTRLPLAGAKIYAKWPLVRNVDAWWYKDGDYPFALSDRNGDYTYTVPAVQEMFINNSTGALNIQARRNMEYASCCNSPASIEQYSNFVSVNNLFEGATITVDNLEIPNPGPIDCGDVDGIIKDGLTGARISNAHIFIHNIEEVSNNGNYLYQCPGYKLPAINSNFHATHPDYYTYDSNGNFWYSPGTSVDVPAHDILHHPDVKLWPIGRGTIVVNVVDARSGNPISGAKVQLTTFTGSQMALTTGADGKQIFTNFLETWPPLDLPNDRYYQQGPQGHILYVTYPSEIYSIPHYEIIPRLRKNEILTINVRLVPSGSGGA
jgi:type II secretory pathway pseudopilin PulG